jgi:hypothetical protein
LELGHQHLETELRAGENGRSRVLVGNLEDLVPGLVGTYDLILFDRSALAPIGGGGGLSRAAREALASRVAPGGTVAWGPAPGGDPEFERVGGWSYAVYARALDVDGLPEAGGSRGEVVLVGGPAAGAWLPGGVEGFEPEGGTPSEPGPEGPAGLHGEEASAT